MCCTGAAIGRYDGRQRRAARSTKMPNKLTLAFLSASMRVRAQTISFQTKHGKTHRRSHLQQFNVSCMLLFLQRDEQQRKKLAKSKQAHTARVCAFAR